MRSPPQVAIQDENDFSPFSIAVLRDYYKLGHAIPEITLLSISQKIG
jgi:hypothetical protein